MARKKYGTRAAPEKRRAVVRMIRERGSRWAAEFFGVGEPTLLRYALGEQVNAGHDALITAKLADFSNISGDAA
jgi:hypothetical protein